VRETLPLEKVAVAWQMPFLHPRSGETIPIFWQLLSNQSGHFLGATLTQFAGIVHKGLPGKAKKAYARNVGYSIT